MNYSKQIPIKYETDIFIAGGGAAGVTAAVAAARAGKRVFLAESLGAFGGLGTTGLVPAFATFSDGKRLISRGIGLEIRKNISKAYTPETYWTPIDAEELKREYDRIMTEAGVEFSFFTTVYDVIAENGKVDTVILGSKSGLFALKAKIFIDCTGDGDLCAACGVPMQEMPAVDQLQPASLGFRLGGVKTELITGLHPATPGAKFQMVSVREIFTRLAGEGVRVPNFGGPWFCTVCNDAAGIVSVNITRTQGNATDGESVTQAECTLREDVHTLFGLLKKHVPAFENSYLITSAAQAGFRESRRIRGIHTLSAAEYASAFHFPDSVARGAHPIDIHRAADSGQDVKFLEKAGYIPYRTMIAKGFDRLLVAGRCISADREAFGSIRVMATAMALGHAAGTAAALCLARACGTTALDTEALRAALLAQGAII